MKTKWMGFVCVLVAGLAVNGWAQCGNGDSGSICDPCGWFRSSNGSSNACNGNGSSVCGEARSSCGFCDWLCGRSDPCPPSETTAYTRSDCPKACPASENGGQCPANGASARTYDSADKACPTGRANGGTAYSRSSDSSYSAYKRDRNGVTEWSSRTFRDSSRPAAGRTLWYDVRQHARGNGGNGGSWGNGSSCNGGNGATSMGTPVKRCLMKCNGDWVVIDCPD